MSGVSLDELRWAYQNGALSLSGHGLSELPKEIGQIQDLRVLELYANRLRKLPDELWQLRALEKLDLNDNLLQTLPPDIIRLTNLRTLDLSNNPLRTLPTELADMVEDGLALTLDGTRFSEAIGIGRDPRAVATYIRSLSDAKTLYEAKVILVGEGNVGKTSLVAALNNHPFVVDRPTTHGIEIHQLKLPHPSDATKLTLHTWDFGGQEVYRITHQFFFSQRALYLVVWNPREGQEQNEVEGWLRRLRLRVGHDAPTLIVATHGDERRAELDYPRLRREFPGMLRGHLIVDSRTGRGIDELKAAIAVNAAELPQMGHALSGRWISARDDVLKLVGTTPQVEYGLFEQICRRYGLSENETVTLANLLHDLGSIIYYGDDDGLCDVVVLDPEWLTKAIGAVLEDTQTREQMGVLDHVRLREIWSRSHQPAYPRQFHPYFLRLMEKFDVSYRLSNDENRSLVAQLVPYERPDLPWEPASPLRDGHHVLRLVCDVNEPAPGLMPWLTVRHHLASTNRHWRSGVFLKHPIDLYDSEALLELTPSDRHLSVEVRAPSPDLFFNVLRDSIEDLLGRRWPGLTYSLHVPCPKVHAGRVRCDGRFPLDGLVAYRQRGGRTYPCLRCQADHDVALLLTGFSNPDVALHIRLEDLSGNLTKVRDGIERLESHAGEASRQAADTTDLLRKILKAIGAEVSDCPRLFTLVTAETPRLGRLRGKSRLRMTLWCEQTGAYHALPSATYELQQPKAWLIRIAPYVMLTFRLLRVGIPIASAVLGVVLTEDQLKSTQHEIDLMKALVESLPQPSNDVRASFDEKGHEVLTRAEGAAARAIRVALRHADPMEAFGGLRRVLAPSGEYLWVCPHHYRDYDAGLPTLP